MNNNSELVVTVWEKIRDLTRTRVDLHCEQNFAVGLVLMHVCSASTVPSHLSFRVLNECDIKIIEKDLAKVRLQLSYGNTEMPSMLQIDFVIRASQLSQYARSLEMLMVDFKLQRDDEDEGKPKNIGAFLDKEFDVMNFEFSRNVPGRRMGVWLNTNGLIKQWYDIYRPEV